MKLFYSFIIIVNFTTCSTKIYTEKSINQENSSNITLVKEPLD